jgi:hypothetical protein
VVGRPTRLYGLHVHNTTGVGRGYRVVTVPANTSFIVHARNHKAPPFSVVFNKFFLK